MQDKFKLIKLVVMFVVLLWFFKEYFEKLQMNIFWLEQPFIVVNLAIISFIIYMLFLLWDNFLWKEKRFFMPLIWKILWFYDYPNLNWTWIWKFNSSYKYDWDKNLYITKWEREIEIIQTYSSLIIKWSFNKSKFSSIFSILRERNNRWELTYMYENNPTDIALKTAINWWTHKWFCHLLFDDNDMTLDWFYSNDESRKTRWSLGLKKIISKNENNNILP